MLKQSFLEKICVIIDMLSVPRSYRFKSPKVVVFRAVNVLAVKCVSKEAKGTCTLKTGDDWLFFHKWYINDIAVNKVKTTTMETFKFW